MKIKEEKYIEINDDCTFDKVITKLQKIRDSLPYKSSQIKLDCNYGMSFYLDITREETLEEIKIRKDRELASKAIIEKMERNKLKELLEKYPEFNNKDVF